MEKSLIVEICPHISSPMTQATIGKWGRSLAVRVPLTIAQSLGLADGERVEIEERDGDVLIRRNAEARGEARARARRAAEAIRADRAGHRLDDANLRDLIDEGRRD